MPVWSKLLLIAAAAAVLVVFAWGGKGHFRSEKMPLGMIVISVLSVLSFIAFAVSVLQMERSGWIALGLVLQALSLVLFIGAVRATRATRLTLIGDDDVPTFLVAGGPYKWVRHPFYVAYIIFWAGCAIIAQSFISVLALVVMTGLYIHAARSEEAKFGQSELADRYRRYQQSTGFLWPKF